MAKLPLALVGPSGSGKTTLVSFLLSKFSQSFEFSISSTTRAKRPNEVNGKAYNFLTHEEFMTQVQNNEFVEWAEVHGNLYGTTRSAIKQIQNYNKICLLDIDVQGVLNLYKSEIIFNRICIIPKDEESIKKRLMKRGTESPEALKIRLDNMNEEIRVMKQNPEVFCNYVINDSLKDTKDKLLEYVKKMYPDIV